MEEITASELITLLHKGEAIQLIDVREDFEVAEGKIPEALHIPLQHLLLGNFPVEKSKRYVLICRSGRRSELACRYLEAHGIQATNVIDGMLGWEGSLERKGT